jgi:hypothetical protein
LIELIIKPITPFPSPPFGKEKKNTRLNNTTGKEKVLIVFVNQNFER